VLRRKCLISTVQRLKIGHGEAGIRAADIGNDSASASHLFIKAF
jgi:hypothetical protein